MNKNGLRFHEVQKKYPDAGIYPRTLRFARGVKRKVWQVYPYGKPFYVDRNDGPPAVIEDYIAQLTRIFGF